MHPGMIAWWNLARRHAAHHAQHHADYGVSAECGPRDCGPQEEPSGRGRRGGHEHRHGHEHGHGPEHAHASGEHDSDFGGGSLGVRRPLRFLAYKLDLDEKQVAQLARILNELKTERAQAEVDHRRSIAGFADAISAEAFDEGNVSAVATARVKSAERLRDAVVKALGGIHALLTADQRAKFAYLIRTGALTL